MIKPTGFPTCVSRVTKSTKACSFNKAITKIPNLPLMKNNRRLASFNTLIRNEKGHFGRENVELQDIFIDWSN